MIQVIINYDQSQEIYTLYNRDLDIAFTSSEMFKVLVLFNSYLTETCGEEFNVLKSDEIEYILDSSSMKQMITSNVKLIKRLSRLPTAFQQSSEKFGGNTSQLSQMSRTSLNRSNSSTDEFDRMMSKKKAFKSSKFK